MPERNLTAHPSWGALDAAPAARHPKKSCLKKEAVNPIKHSTPGPRKEVAWQECTNTKSHHTHAALLPPMRRVTYSNASSLSFLAPNPETYWDPTSAIPGPGNSRAGAAGRSGYCAGDQAQSGKKKSRGVDRSKMELVGVPSDYEDIYLGEILEDTDAVMRGWGWERAKREERKKREERVRKEERERREEKEREEKEKRERKEERERKEKKEVREKRERLALEVGRGIKFLSDPSISPEKVDTMVKMQVEPEKMQREKKKEDGLLSKWFGGKSGSGSKSENGSGSRSGNERKNAATATNSNTAFGFNSATMSGLPQPPQRAYHR